MGRGKRMVVMRCGKSTKEEKMGAGLISDHQNMVKY